MRKLLFILSFFIAVASQAQVKVLGYVVPNNTADAYPTHLDIYGAGGFRTVASLVERNAITPLRRRAGMLVYVVDSSKTYQLANDLTTWSTPVLGSGTGNGSGEVDPIFLAHVAHTITSQRMTYWDSVGYMIRADSARKEMHDTALAHDYSFDPTWFTVTNRYVTFAQPSYVESDPIFLGHVASSITQEDIDRWNSAFDTSLYYTKTQMQQILHDSLINHEYKYYVDGQTIGGIGSFDDPFHVIYFGNDTTKGGYNNYYTREQVDSAIAANFHAYSAGFGLFLNNSTFSLDTSYLVNLFNTVTQTSSDTAVQDIIQKDANTLTIVKKTSIRDIVLGTGNNGGNDGLTVESDPVFLAHVASSITQTDIDRWNNFSDSAYVNNLIRNFYDSSSKYFFDGVTILGDGTQIDPFRTNGYSREQVDSAIAANYHVYGAGYGLILENSTFRVDTTLFHSGGGTGGSSGTVTSVSATGTQGIIASVTNPFTTPAIALRADTSFLVTSSKFNSFVNTYFGDTTINNGSSDTTIVDGDNITIGNNVSWYIVNPQVTLGSLTLTLPSAPKQGQTLEISFGGIINSGDVVTALTIAPNVGQSLLATGEYNNIEVRDKLVYKFNSSNHKWYR